MAKRRPPSTANDSAVSEARTKPKTTRAAAPRRATATAPTSAPEPSEDDIRYRAFLRYLERGGGDGLALDDWVHAERELKKDR